MSSVKPLTVVTKVGRLRREGLKGSDDIYTPNWVHEDCVTLADAERYAREKVNAALICERDAVARNAPAREAFNERVAERLVRTLMHEPAPANHGAFYLETQADLVLRARLDDQKIELEKLRSRVSQLETAVIP